MLLRRIQSLLSPAEMRDLALLVHQYFTSYSIMVNSYRQTKAILLYPRLSLCATGRSFAISSHFIRLGVKLSDHSNCMLLGTEHRKAGLDLCRSYNSENIYDRVIYLRFIPCAQLWPSLWQQE
jgi:hypothetical protein